MDFKVQVMQHVSKQCTDYDVIGIWSHVSGIWSHVSGIKKHKTNHNKQRLKCDGGVRLN